MHNMQNIQNMHNMISMYNMQNMQNMQAWTPVAFVLLQHRNKGTRVLFHPCICLGFNREQQRQFSGPDIINSELKSAFGESRRADEHPVLAVGLLQFFGVISQQEILSDQDLSHSQSGGLYTG
jgi:hypothetical protein